MEQESEPGDAVYEMCNHPELFERREPRSPLLLSLPAPALPRLPFLDPAFPFLSFVPVSAGQLERAVTMGWEPSAEEK